MSGFEAGAEVLGIMGGFALIPVSLATSVWILRKAGYVVRRKQ